MTHNTHLNRRSALQVLGGTACAALAGCLGGDEPSNTATGTTASDSGTALIRVSIEETKLVVVISSEATVDQVNLIQPDGELFGQRAVAVGVEQVSFDLETTYASGEYRILALNEGDSIAEMTKEIRPELQILDVGLYRNNPEKPWDEVYGESKTDTKKNAEAFVTIENVGSGPEAVVRLRFDGDVPHTASDYDGSGIYGFDEVVIPPGETADLYSDALPFGPKLGEEGMGCSPTGNQGSFSVSVWGSVGRVAVSTEYDVEYSGSEEMHDCTIAITER